MLVNFKRNNIAKRSKIPNANCRIKMKLQSFKHNDLCNSTNEK